MDEFALRRVSAPLFLPVGSPLLDANTPGVRITLPSMNQEVEIVGSLNCWLRGQLTRYDIAPGFGVFTIMKALNPALPMNATSSPHVDAWGWQQVVDSNKTAKADITAEAQRIYKIIVEAEQMVLQTFPHLHQTLSNECATITQEQLLNQWPGNSLDRCIHQHLHPADNADSLQAATWIFRTDGHHLVDGELWVWNNNINSALRLADIALWPADGIASSSVGGNIYRGQLALQILQQDRLLE
jgi:hypothetical protein